MVRIRIALALGSLLLLFVPQQILYKTVFAQNFTRQVVITPLAATPTHSDTSTPQPPTPQPTSTPTPPPYTLIFSAEPGPDVSTLQEIANGAASDDDILQDVVAYYHANQDRLAILWREDNPTRLAGIFTMYVVHISTIYGDATYPASLVEYLNNTRAQCGTYTYAALRIANALGLTWRTVEFVGEHAWLEISVDGQWEAFDATTNTWLSRGVNELMQGMPREYRQFYTPLLDVNRPDARFHMAEGYDMQRLRQRMPGVGISYMPPGQLNIRYPSDYGL